MCLMVLLKALFLRTTRLKHVTLMWHELFGGSDEYLAILAGLLLEAVRQVHSGERITSVPRTIPHHLGCPG